MKKSFLILFSLLLAVTVRAQYAGNDNTGSPSAPTGHFNPYTGNISFRTHDLTVAEAVGTGLSWQRQANSRTVQNQQLFGWGHNWTDNWQWELTDVGPDSSGRRVLSVRLPDGTAYRFTEVSPGNWGTVAGVGDRLEPNGDGFDLLRPNGWSVHFALAGSQGYEATTVTDARGNATTLAYVQGQLSKVTEPAGRWLSIHYRSLVGGYVVIDYVQSSDDQKVVYAYTQTDAGYPVLSSVTYPDKTQAHYTYATVIPGALPLLAQADDPRGDLEVRGRAFVYQAAGAVGQMAREQAGVKGGDLTTLAAGTQGMRSYLVRRDSGIVGHLMYQPGGNLAEQVDALGHATTYTYGHDGRGFRTGMTDATGAETHYVNGTWGLPIKETRADGSVTAWARDDRGRVVKLTNALGHTTTYQRDQLGRVVKTVYADGTTEQTTYNTFGQVVAFTDRNGGVTRYGYNSQGQLFAAHQCHEWRNGVYL